MERKFKILTWIPAVIMMIIIFRFSASTGERSSELSLELTKGIVGIVSDFANTNMNQEEELKIIEMIHTPIRKLGHITEYAVLGFALCLPFYFYYKKRKGSLYVYSEGFLIIYACIDEFHQLFVAERSGRFTDVLIDGLGGIIGIFGFFILLKITRFMILKIDTAHENV